jgi:hypothetical protein
MNSQSINAFKRLAIGSDDVKFLVSNLARGKGVALNRGHYSALRLLRRDSLAEKQRKQATDTRIHYLIKRNSKLLEICTEYTVVFHFRKFGPDYIVQ